LHLGLTPPPPALTTHRRRHRHLRRFLEEELARRYREAAPATLALLQEKCSAIAQELLAADSRLRNAEDVGAMRRVGGQQQGSGPRLPCLHVAACGAGSCPPCLPWVVVAALGAAHRRPRR
jgi:hypothetical protein